MPTLAGGFSQAGWRYTGAAAIVLALLAPVLALRWPPLGFWLIAGTAAIALGLAITTPLHTLSYALLPKFELLHTHLPGRIRLLIPLVVAMLAGATADALACAHVMIDAARRMGADDIDGLAELVGVRVSQIEVAAAPAVSFAVA